MLFLSVRQEEQKVEECLVRTLMEGKRAQVEISNTHGNACHFPSTVEKLQSYFLFEISKNLVKCKLFPTFYKRLTRLTRVVELPSVRESK